MEGLMSIGIWQVVLILLIVLIIFGAGKLPKVMGDVAKGMRNFKAGLKEDEADEAEPKTLRSDAAPGSPPPAGPAKVERDETVKS
jgi:sec-independent protein translocase protein TatA